MASQRNDGAVPFLHMWPRNVSPFSMATNDPMGGLTLIFLFVLGSNEQTEFLAPSSKNLKDLDSSGVL